MNRGKSEKTPLKRGVMRLGFCAPGVFTVAISHAAEHDLGLQKAIADVRYLEEQLHWTCCGKQQTAPIFTAEEIETLYEQAAHISYGDLRLAVEERYLAFTAVCSVCGRFSRLKTYV